MESQHPKNLSMMTEMFSKMPTNTEFFVIRHLDMKGRKVDMPSKLIRSEIHCFFFITSGEALITIGDEPNYFRANECAAIPAGQAFSVRYFDDCTGYMGGFNIEYLNSSNDGKNIIQAFSILRRWSPRKVYFEPDQAKCIEDIFKRLCVESSGRNNKNIIRAYLTTLLTEMEEASQSTEGTSDENRTENEICNKYIELVFESSNHSIPLSHYAEKLNITKDYLHKVIKRFTGKTPLAWISEAVILEAKVLLSRTNMTINEISQEVGFDDPSYFSRIFKKHTDTTPLEYRREQMSQNCQL